MERLHRAHGHLVAFHHVIGHALDHLAEASAFEERARRTVSDGERHVAEREMQRTWRDRAEN